MKIVKKIFQIMMVTVFIIPTFTTPVTNVKAKTLGQLKQELDEKQNELNANKQQQQLTEQQISDINSKITSIKSQISQTYTDIASLDADIESLNNQIKEKQEQVKKIVNFLQISSGKTAYLEYVFGAKDFTDFIYRLSVSEQLAKYNDQLVDEYNSMIEQNKQKQKEIEEKRVSLGTQEDSLSQEQQKLGEQLDNTKSTSITIADDITYQKEVIELYKSKGCSDNEDIATCGRKLIPAGTAFYRPLMSSRITSEYGTRYYMGKSFHEGIDMAASEGTTVYAIGNGMVATIMYRNSCGGNMVIVHHNIKGKIYTSVYAHLLSVNVSQGQIVDRNTIVGTSGGQSTKSYDTCTGGAHLHLTVSACQYGPGKDNCSFNQMNYTYSLDPRSMINFPSGTVWWSDRLTAY